jgi:hypothetical protein
MKWEEEEEEDVDLDDIDEDDRAAFEVLRKVCQSLVLVCVVFNLD